MVEFSRTFALAFDMRGPFASNYFDLREKPMIQSERLCRLAAVLLSLVVGCHHRTPAPSPAPINEAHEAEAISLSQNVRERHMPYGTVIDPVFASSIPASPGYSSVTSYARTGDSAIWTGHYLAGEAFRYRVAPSTGALENVNVALQGLTALIDVTGKDLLARVFVPADSPYLDDIKQENSRRRFYNGSLDGKPQVWVGDTSRDQYCGAFYGLAAASDMVEDPKVRSQIRDNVTRLLDNLLANGWNVVMPDKNISTTFGPARPAIDA